ncbi:MAG: DnaA regulatory inactivator Hda [Proteobacteria bacterium ST_bin12]|nr:MAG: DnaA regulatory inactivator Hda [Proteobacteria bacterium ST_bin12]
MKQLLLDIKPAAPPTLQNFVVGRNAEALSSLQAAVNGQNPQFIYLWGESGSGKSHLLQACQAIGASIVDDVYLLSNDAQIDLFNQYNRRKEAGEWMITAGLHAPAQMGLRDDVATRLAWGLVYQLQPLNDMEKATALKQHAFERGMKLPDEVVDYCLRYLRRDLPTLMATLDAVDEWSLTMQKPITVPMLRKLLQLNLDLND